MTDLAHFDFRALNAAMKGDFSLLAAKLRSGEHINADERSFIADRLEGKLKIQSGTKVKVTKLDNLAYEAFLFLTEHQKDMALYARDSIAKCIGETEANVRKRIKRAKIDPIRLFIMQMHFYFAEKDSEFSVSEPALFRMSVDEIKMARNELIE